MTDPRELIDAYANQGAAWDEDGQKVSRWLCAERAFAALRAVVGIHKPHESGDVTCVGCSTRADTYDDIPWPCPTVHAITKALEG